MLKHVVSLGLVSGIMAFLASCGKDKDKSSHVPVPVETSLNLAELSGEWINTIGDIPLVRTYKTDHGTEVRLEMTPSYRFARESFTSQMICVFTVFQETKTIVVEATTEVIPTTNGFIVEAPAGRVQADIVGGERVACAPNDIMAGVYAVRKFGDLILLQSPGNAAEEMLKPTGKK